MTDREKLILHLQNLLKSDKNTATLDVKFLLEILNALPEPLASKPATTTIDIVSVDGGDFYDELNS
jgi:hypothetical protein